MFRKLGLLAIALPLLVSAGFAADNPLIGSWKLNIAKSKFFPGPPPKARTEKFEPSGPNGMKWTDVHVAADGKTENLSYTVNFDGKYYPFYGAPQLRDQVLAVRMGPRAFRLVYKKAGEVVQVNYMGVSEDGKTLLVLASVMSPDGKALSNINFYDKQ